MNPRTKSRATNLVLALCSVGFVFAAMELVLRVFPQLMSPEARLKVHWAGQPSMPTQADTVTGYEHRPNYRTRFRTGEIDFSYGTDEHGFRNPTPWPDTADVVIVGDSQVFGYGVDDDSTWTSILGQDFPKTRVLNLGLPGMAPEQYRRVYEKFGVGLHPKVLIFGLFPANDLSDQREFDAWLRAGKPGEFATWKFSRGRKPKLVQRVLQHSWLAWSVRVAMRNLGQSHDVETVTFPDGGRLQYTPAFEAADAAIATPESPEFQSVMRSIESCRQIAEKNGTAFLVVVFSTKEDVYLPLRGESVPQLIAPFTRALGAAGIPYLDMTGPMQEEAKQQKRLFWEVDGHPNAAGYRVIANTVGEYLRQHAVAYHLTDRQVPPGP